MAFCRQCGKKLDEGLKFCPGCGASVNTQSTASENKAAIPGKVTKSEKPPVDIRGFSQEDIDNNRAMAVLAYIIFLIPLFAAKKSKFARYHTNQAIVLILTIIVIEIVLSLLMGSGSGAIILLSIVGYFVVGGGIFVFSIMGIVHAAKGEVKPLPFIGKLTILKY